MSIELRKGFAFGGWLPKVFEGQQNMLHLQSQSFNEENPHLRYMHAALCASMANGALANPNPSVGCVVVKDNQILSCGATEAYGLRHAERVAFAGLSESELRGSEVYVTLEPCTHTGKQPPCVELFRDKGIEKVYVGSLDPNPLVHGKGVQMLNSMGIKTEVGLLEKEIMAWNYPFYIQQIQKKLFVALKWAQSIDGCMADDNNGWRWISSQYSRQYAHWLRQKYDAILIGAGTLLNDFPMLDVRNISLPFKRNPLKVIFDPSGKIFFCNNDVQTKLKERTLNTRDKKVIIVSSEVFSRISLNKNDWITFLTSDSTILIKTIEENLINAESITKILKSSEVEKLLERPLQSVLVEGGPRLLSAFIEERIFDLMHIFIAPLFLGGTKNKLFSSIQRGFLSSSTRVLAEVPRYQVIVQEKIENDLLLEIL